MHAAFRRSICLASRQPALRIAGRRRTPQSFRRLHISSRVGLAIDPTPSEQPSTSEPDITNKRKRTGASVKTSAPQRLQSAEGGESAAEAVPENGGDHEKSSVYGSASRRALRKRKQDGIPPIKVPAWFLRHNVRLHELDASLTPRSRVEYGQRWRLWPLQAIRNRVETNGPQETLVPSDAEVEDFIKKAKGVELAIRQVGDAKFQEFSEEDKQDCVERAGASIIDFAHTVDRELTRGALDTLLGRLNQDVPDCLKEIERFRRAHILPVTKEQNGGDDETPFQLSPAVMEEILALAHAGLSASGSGKPHLSLLCPIDGASYFLDAVVEEVATELQADLIRLDAQDLAQIVGDYVSETQQSSNPVWKLGYDAGTSLRSTQTSMIIARATEEANEDEEENDEDDEDSNSNQAQFFNSRSSKFSSMIPIQPMTTIVADNLPDALSKLQSRLGKMPGFFQPFGAQTPTNSTEGTSSRGWRNVSGGQEWNDMKISALLISLMQAHRLKYHDSTSSPIIPIDVVDGRLRRRLPADEQNSPQPVSSDLAEQAGNETPLQQPTTEYGDDQESHLDLTPSTNPHTQSTGRLVLHIRGLKDINATPTGRRILDRVLEIIARRQVTGHQIIVVGTSASTALAPMVSQHVMESLQSEGGGSPFTSVVVTTKPPLTETERARREKQFDNDRRRYGFDVNARHIHNLSLRMQGQPHDPDTVDWVDFAHGLRQSLSNNPSCGTVLTMLENRILPPAEIQRMVSTAIGKKGTPGSSDTFEGGLTGGDITDAISLLEESFAAKTAWIQRIQQNEEASRSHMPFKLPLPLTMPTVGDPIQDPKVEQAKKKMNAREKALMRGVVNPDQIHVNFDDVHAPTETKETLKMLTTLALKRPDAFKYGILAKDRISGLLLYGPPGTGKTMLAKAVAKESGATMLEVSGADMLEMYVGEGEKNIQAVFSLAKKLAPCVLFIDEADSIFAARRSSGQHHAHRELLNQFLKEWDGMQETTAFIMIATNRPFDIDQAALRRVPRRVLVDLPSEKDREAILQIHLKDEVVDNSVSCSSLASRTPLYSGSDLKNIAVAAALAAVREENDQAAKHSGDESFQYPEKRTLHARHFETALEEISASISEDMDTLGAIRKFDEKYGDRRGRKKKKAYGFTAEDGEVKEDAAKVRT